MEIKEVHLQIAKKQLQNLGHHQLSQTSITIATSASSVSLATTTAVDYSIDQTTLATLSPLSNDFGEPPSQ